MLGERIKELRKKSKLTQEQLAKELHLTKTSICCYEKGYKYPSIETLKLLADIFDVTLDYLVGRTNQR